MRRRRRPMMPLVAGWYLQPCDRDGCSCCQRRRVYHIIKTDGAAGCKCNAPVNGLSAVPAATVPVELRCAGTGCAQWWPGGPPPRGMYPGEAPEVVAFDAEGVLAL